MTDLEIAKNAKLEDISQIAKKLGIDQIEPYGSYKAKCTVEKNIKGKLILVTAINPTAAGEGKTTVSIGLADGLAKIGKSVCLALREPSLGPVFGIKGGAAGGGYAQVVPMQDINLHFTGDLHAITAANNLLCALIDNHIFHGNELRLDKIFFQRCTDTNDRALRGVNVGISKSYEGRAESFVITAASEVMAVLCLSKDLSDLKERLGNICIGEDISGKFIYARDLKAHGAMAALLVDAIKPNLVQTLEGTPAFIHGGPFANIAHGCNSIIATYAALSCADFAVTEAGFGADLGAEKFFDLKCRVAGLEPAAVVVVATVRALKLHGGADKNALGKENLQALKSGAPNLIKHIDNIKNIFKKPVVVAVNRFDTDSQAELEAVCDIAKSSGAEAVLCQAYSEGGDGAKELAQTTARLCQTQSKLEYAYELNQSIAEKIETIAKKVYGAGGADFSQTALEKIAAISRAGFNNLPVIIAKTQYSLSDNAKLYARPEGFKIFVRDIILKSGAGFVVAVCGSINLMPGLAKKPAAENIDIDDGGITGLF